MKIIFVHTVLFSRLSSDDFQMKFKTLFQSCCCCCCCQSEGVDSLDVRTSGYYNSSRSDTESCLGIAIMTPENFQEILNRNKYVLVQFNDRKWVEKLKNDKYLRKINSDSSVNDEALVSAWHETVELIAEQNIAAAEIHDRGFLERLGIREDSATEGLITQFYKNGKFLAAFNHNKFDVCTQNYVNFVNYAMFKKPFKLNEKSFDENEEELF